MDTQTHSEINMITRKSTSHDQAPFAKISERRTTQVKEKQNMGMLHITSVFMFLFLKSFMAIILTAHSHPKQLRRKVFLLNYILDVKISLSPLQYLVNNHDKKMDEKFFSKKKKPKYFWSFHKSVSKNEDRSPQQVSRFFPSSVMKVENVRNGVTNFNNFLTALNSNLMTLFSTTTHCRTIITI